MIEEDYDRHDKIRKQFEGYRRTFSIEARGEAVYWIRNAKKKAGLGTSRGSFVSRAVCFYVRNHPMWNTKGRIAALESEIKFLKENISGLQQVITEYASGTR